MRALLTASLAMAALLVSVAGSPSVSRTKSRAASPQVGAPSPGERARAVAAWGRRPLHFEANHGQADGRVRFVARGSGYGVQITDSGAVLSFRSTRSSGTPRLRSAVVRMGLAGASGRPMARGAEALRGRVNYLRGRDPAQWRINVPTFAKVRCDQVYPGIDLVYYGSRCPEGRPQLEYDFVVAPGADPGRIRLAFSSADEWTNGRVEEWTTPGRSGGLHLAPNGDLLVRTAAGTLRQHRPVAYQELEGTREPVQASYSLQEETSEGETRPRAGHLVALQLGDYDPTRPLVIDPVLSFATFLGGSAAVVESAQDVAVDALGNVYVAGTTESADFPTTPGSLDSTHGGADDCFITKLDPTGSSLVYSTYLGGSGNDLCFGMALASGDEVVLTGDTESTDFPTTPGAFDTTLNGDDGFLARLNSPGSALVYSTLAGGSGFDTAREVVIDPTGQTCVVGYTASLNFPTTANAFDASFNGGTEDAFALCVDPAGNLIYSTFLGGSAGDAGLAVAAGGAGLFYIGGSTYSTNFPTTAGALQTAKSGNNKTNDAFVTKLSIPGSSLAYSTYLGGTGNDSAEGVGVDAAGSAHIVGTTASSRGFPTTTNAFDRSHNGSQDAFFARLNAAGGALLYSTYLGGAGMDRTQNVALDGAGRAWVVGYTWSSNYPTSSGAFDTTFGGLVDAFISRIDPAASGAASLLYSTYLGGTAPDYGKGIALDSAGNVYVAGETGSSNFPLTPGAWDTTGDGREGFVAKFTLP